MSFSNPRVFRATLESWIGQLLLPLVFFFMLTITAVRYAGLNALAGGLGLGILVLVAALDYVLPMARNWLQVDDCTLDGSLNGQTFRIYWYEIMAAWVAVLRGKRYLCLGTQAGTVVLPLRFFNDSQVWAAVQERVPAGALKESAIFGLPDYRKWVQARTAGQGVGTAPALESGPCPVTDHWLIQLGGWAGLTFFLFGLAGAIQIGQVWTGMLFLGLIAVTVIVLRGWGITEIAPEGIQRHTLFTGWHMAWVDVREIEMDPWNLVVVLVAEGRQRVIPGPWFWNGLKKKNALALMHDQASSRQIPLRRSMAAWSRILGRTRFVR